MIKKVVFVCIIILLVIIFFYFQKDSLLNKKNNFAASNKIKVTASFYPLYFLASEIGGDKVIVENIIPLGSEPHDFEPTAKQLADISQSNIFILNGDNLEAWGQKVANNLDKKTVFVITATNGLSLKTTDPHVWLDPISFKKEAENIEQGYVQAAPAQSGYFRTNLARVLKTLDLLDREYRNGLKNCKTRNFITSHAAFSYLALRYGLNQIPLSGLSGEDELSGKQMVEIIDTIKKENLKTIFIERLESPKIAQTIASEAGVKTLILDPIEGLTVENEQKKENYLTLMMENLQNLKEGLECKNQFDL